MRTFSLYRFLPLLLLAGGTAACDILPAPETSVVEPTPSILCDIGECEDDTWYLGEHPCVGNRTDALWCDDATTCFVGCGTTTSGFGLYVTDTGGVDWEAVETTPVDYFVDERVLDVFRADDGLLYVAGELDGDDRVISIDAEGNVATVYSAGSQASLSFTAGNYRQSGERAIAESLTGTDIVYRDTTVDPEFVSGAGFWAGQEDAGVQLLDLEVRNGAFYGVGSTISQPPYVFWPAWDDEFGFGIISLSTDTMPLMGELWTLDLSQTYFVAGGVDQDRDVGIVATYDFAQGGEPQDATSWTVFDVSNVFAEASTWVHGVCIAADETIYAVGRESRVEWGFVLRSTDGGGTFEDITPYDDSGTSLLEAMYECTVTDEALLMAGAQGQVAAMPF